MLGKVFHIYIKKKIGPSICFLKLFYISSDFKRNTEEKFHQISVRKKHRRKIRVNYENKKNNSSCYVLIFLKIECLTSVSFVLN